MAGKHSSDPNVFLLPDIGEGLQEAEIVRWLVKVGDNVEENQSLAEVNTDKALTEIPSPRAGTIATLHGADGQIVKIGDPFVTYESGGPTLRAGPPTSSSTASNGPGATASPPRPDDAVPTLPDNPPERTEDAGTVVGQVGSTLAGVSSDGKALATPAVRRLARDLSIDINTIPGTGIGGRVTEKDVRAAATGGTGLRPVSGGTGLQPVSGGTGLQPVSGGTGLQPVSGGTGLQPVSGGTGLQPVSGGAAAVRNLPNPPRPTAPPAPSTGSKPVPPMPAMPPGQDTQRIPLRGVRRNIAQALRHSVNHAVHFNVMDEADVTALDDLRRRLASASGEKVSFLPFVCSAVCRALTTDFAALNAWMDEEKSEIVRHRSVHLGIATDTEQGLMVPVVRDADKMGVLEIGRAVNATAKSARDKSITRENLSGSTFTISNVGSYAGRFATPIINSPEVGILAVGRTRDGMVTKDGWFRVGKLMPLSLACDHRVVDGATAALALARIVELLQDPEQLMAPARGV